MNIRQAKPEEGPLVSDLALRSKAHWDYDPEFIEACREDLTISEEYINENFVYVLEDQAEVIGFFCFFPGKKPTKLDFLYMDPAYIGKGYGRTLWQAVLEKAKEIDMIKFTIDADPSAEGFYLKMGAKRIGDVESTVFEGRQLPLLEVKL